MARGAPSSWTAAAVRSLLRRVNELEVKVKEKEKEKEKENEQGSFSWNVFAPDFIPAGIEEDILIGENELPEFVPQWRPEKGEKPEDPCYQRALFPFESKEEEEERWAEEIEEAVPVEAAFAPSPEEKEEKKRKKKKRVTFAPAEDEPQPREGENLYAEGCDNIRSGLRELLEEPAPAVVEPAVPAEAAGPKREPARGVLQPPEVELASAGATQELAEAAGDSAAAVQDPQQDVVVLTPAAKEWICWSVAARREEALLDPSCIDLPFELDMRAARALHPATTVAEAHQAVEDHFGSDYSDSAFWYSDMLFYAIEDVRSGDWG